MFRQKLLNAIPGGAHTYSKGQDQFPSNAPQILERGSGAYVFDHRGERFLDYGMGLRSVAIGYSNRKINNAALRQIKNGNNLTLPSIIELKAAETFLDAMPNSEMVKFAKNGSSAVTGALKLARAYTGRTIVAVCSDHPFFSYDDWFISSTEMPRGVFQGAKSQIVKFKYNDIQSLRNLFDLYPEQIAAVILEPATNICPHGLRECLCLTGVKVRKKNFLQDVQNLSRQNKAVFILDEMITGFRWSSRGAQDFFDVKPDLSTHGKAMANGFSVACVSGIREIMSLGSIENPKEERVFLLSSTHGAEMSSLGAFVETAKIYEKKDVSGHLWHYGNRLIESFNDISRSYELEGFCQMKGFSCSPYIDCKDAEGASSLSFKTLFNQEMVKSGVLMPWVSLSLSHNESEFRLSLRAFDSALSTYAKAIASSIDLYLEGPVQKPVFRRFN